MAPIPSTFVTGPPAVPQASRPLCLSIVDHILSVRLLFLAIFVGLGYCWFRRRPRIRRMESPEKKPAADNAPCGSSPQTEPLPIKPIYPWIAPPKPLPGPYDPRLFPPLPNPTVRRHSHPDVNVDDTETLVVSYVKRVSIQDVEGEKVMVGKVAKVEAENGWRRNQWTVEAG
jgi:hypothetical protein